MLYLYIYIYIIQGRQYFLYIYIYIRQGWLDAACVLLSARQFSAVVCVGVIRAHVSATNYVYIYICVHTQHIYIYILM